MLWDPTSITWAKQIMLMEILLPATFTFVAALVLAVPYITRDEKRQTAPARSGKPHLTAERRSA